MHGSKTPKNFYIRPTTGVSIKGGFSVECRGQQSQRDSHIRNTYKNSNNTKNNLPLYVTSYGFRRITSQENHINNNNQLFESDTLRAISSRSSKLSPIAGSEQRLLTTQAQIPSNQNNNLSSTSINFTKISSYQLHEQHHNNQLKTTLNPSSQHSSSAKYLYQQKQPNTKNPHRNQFQQNSLTNCIQIEKIYSYGCVNGQISSHSSNHNQRITSYQKSPQTSRNKEKGLFAVDISNVQESNKRQQEQEQDSRQTRERKDNNSEENENEEEGEEEQLSEINIKDGFHCEDSFEDIQSTNGFEFHNQKNLQSFGVIEVMKKQSGNDKSNNIFTPQINAKGSLESNDQLLSSRKMPQEKRTNTQTNNHTNSKQSDETAASSNIPKSPSIEHNQNNFKENNHFQLINLTSKGSNSQGELGFQPPTTNNMQNKVLIIKQNNYKLDNSLMS